jgi:hypothetical protein
MVKLSRSGCDSGKRYGKIAPKTIPKIAVASLLRMGANLSILTQDSVIVVRLLATQ